MRAKLMALAVGVGLVAAVGSQASAQPDHPPRGGYGWHGGERERWHGGEREGWRGGEREGWHGGEREGWHGGYAWRGPVYRGGYGYGYDYGYGYGARVWVPGYWAAGPWGRVWVEGCWR